MARILLSYIMDLPIASTLASMVVGNLQKLHEADTLYSSQYLCTCRHASLWKTGRANRHHTDNSRHPKSYGNARAARHWDGERPASSPKVDVQGEARGVEPGEHGEGHDEQDGRHGPQEHLGVLQEGQRGVAQEGQVVVVAQRGRRTARWTARPPGSRATAAAATAGTAPLRMQGQATLLVSDASSTSPPIPLLASSATAPLQHQGGLVLPLPDTAGSKGEASRRVCAPYRSRNSGK